MQTNDGVMKEIKFHQKHIVTEEFALFYPQERTQSQKSQKKAIIINIKILNSSF